MLRDKLLARLREMGDEPDHRQLAAEVLGVRGASAELARRLVQQALVVEDRREAWRRAGERICRDVPASPGVYVLRDELDRALYVGKAVNLRRRLRAHFAERRWRSVKPELSRAVDAEWCEAGSDLEALLREAALIEELQPIVNVQIGAPELTTREVPRSLVRDVIVIVRSIEDDSAELVCARVDGGWMIQRTRRNGADLVVHAARLTRFFHSLLRPQSARGPREENESSSAAARASESLQPPRSANARSGQRRGWGPGAIEKSGAPRAMRNDGPLLAPIIFSWLAGRGRSATRLDPRDARSPRELRARVAALLADDRLFVERLDQRVRV